MIILSDGLMQTLTQNFATVFAGGSIRVFSGAPTTSADMAETGVLLGIISKNGDGTGLVLSAFPTYVSMPGTDRWMYTALASGTAGHFRLVAPGDTGALSTTQPRVNGTIGVAFSGSDMEWDSVTVAAGATYSLDSFVYIVHPISRTA